MKTVPVETMEVQHQHGQVLVTFKRYHYNSPVTQRCRQSDILSRQPLRVKVIISSDSCKQGVQDLVGQQVILLCSEVPPLVLQSE